MKFTYVSAVVFLALCSCSKKDSKRVLDVPPVVAKPEVQKPATDFEGKSKEEILQMKYDKITLKCELWTQYAKELDLTQNASDSFEVDYLNDPLLTKSIVSLKGTAHGRGIELRFKVNNYKIRESIRVKNLDGSTTVAQYSPEIDIEYSYQTSKMSTGGESTMGPMTGYNRSTFVHENDKNESTESLQIGSEENKYIDHLNCQMTSVLKEKYKDQYKIEPKAEN